MDIKKETINLSNNDLSNNSGNIVEGNIEKGATVIGKSYSYNFLNSKLEEMYTAEYWINKGNICLKNLNSQGAFDCYNNATFYKCTEQQLYHCFYNMARIAPSCGEKIIYANNILRLKNIKRTKRDLAYYIFTQIGFFIEKSPILFLIINFIIFFSLKNIFGL